MSTAAIVSSRPSRPDFIQVRLSAEGIAFAGQGATLSIATAHMHYLFIGSALVEVLRAGEWPQLKRFSDSAGKALFEEGTEVAAAVSSTPAAEVSTAPQAVATPTKDSQTAPVKAAAQKSEVTTNGQ